LGELGRIFKEAREAKELTLEKIDQDIKIKPHFVEALETETFDQFPSGPMLRGFIRNYATYLDLNPDEILNLYNNTQPNGKLSLNDGHGIKFMSLSMARRQSVFSLDGFVTVIIVALLLGSALFFAYTQYLEPAQAQINVLDPVEYQVGPNDTEQAILLPTPTLPPTETPSPTPTPSPQYYTGVAIELNVLERSWVQILVDDQKQFEGVLEVGERRNWVGEKRVAIRAGNGGGIEIYVNGQNMGLMGEASQVIDQVWEKVEDTSELEGTPTPPPAPETGS